MQTFLPSPDYSLSAKYLDNLRLNKQILEGCQIYRTLMIGSRWKNHPAVKMWEYHQNALHDYILACHNEWFKNRKRRFHKAFTNLISEFNLGSPLYSNRSFLSIRCFPDSFYSSHRSILLLKGEVDRVRKRLRLAKLPIPKDLRTFHYEELLELEDSIPENIDRGRNWYLQFNWIEKPNHVCEWPNYKEST